MTPSPGDGVGLTVAGVGSESWVRSREHSTSTHVSETWTQSKSNETLLGTLL